MRRIPFAKAYYAIAGYVLRNLHKKVSAQNVVRLACSDTRANREQRERGMAQSTDIHVLGASEVIRNQMGSPHSPRENAERSVTSETPRSSTASSSMVGQPGMSVGGIEQATLHGFADCSSSRMARATRGVSPGPETQASGGARAKRV